MQPIGIQHINSRKCSLNARKSIAFERNLFWVRSLVGQFSCYSRSYAHDHSSLKIRNPPVGFRSNPSSIFISSALSNVFRLFKQMSVSKIEKIKKKEHLTAPVFAKTSGNKPMTSRGKEMKKKNMIYKLLYNLATQAYRYEQALESKCFLFVCLRLY